MFPQHVGHIPFSGRSVAYRNVLCHKVVSKGGGIVKNFVQSVGARKGVGSTKMSFLRGVVVMSAHALYVKMEGQKL